jgi:Fe-S-cluster-containing dehydrogenase component
MTNEKVSRRDFVKGITKAFLGGIVLYGGIRGVLGRSALAASEQGLDDYDWEAHSWGFAVDITKCIGCGRCVVACKEENHVPWEPEFNRTWVERYVITEDGEVFGDSPNGGRDGFSAEHHNVKYENLDIRKSFFVPKLCNQCEKPPCVQVCPVGATYATKDGVVLIDRSHCIGCRYCIQSCPYGARFFLHEYGVVDKCTWCYHRITKGLLPACVEVCPAGARVFGDLSDPESQIRRLLRHETVNTLKPDLGTKPKIFYIGLEDGVR